MSELRVRSIPTNGVEVEGRTVDVRVAPFDTVATVADPPHFVPYREEFLRGCFDHQLNAANRIHANIEHEQGISGKVGHGVSLRHERDGYHLTLTILKTPAGDTTLELLKGGALPDVSAEFHDVRNVQREGVMQRVKANLIGCAFAREGAYPGAGVLAMREELTLEAQTLDAGLLPTDIDPERVQRLRAQGIVLPDRYMQAHLSDEDTSPDGDTPDDETPADDENTTSSEE